MGAGGVCAMAEVVNNGHYLRNHPAGDGPTTSSCGEDEDCDNSQMLKVSHSIKIDQATDAEDWQDVVWEFDNPVVLDKHTTYYVNMAIDETISNSDSFYWYGGSSAPKVQQVNGEDQFSRHQYLGAYKRTNVVVDGMMKFVWMMIPSFYFNLEIQRCVTSLPMITSFSTVGEGTGSCSARSSPRGNIEGPTITFTGKNFFPSKNLRVVFLTADGKMGPHSECEATRNDFTEMVCKAPSFDPYEGVDCSVPNQCTGVHVMPTNDGVNYGPELFSPKFVEPYTNCVAYKSPTGYCDSAVPSSLNASHYDYDHFVQRLGKNQLTYCFSDIYVSVSGDDFRGDGTRARPFRTIQRRLDAANPIDVCVLLPGTYTGTGNRGLRHMGKKIQVLAIEDGPSYKDRSVAAYSSHHAHVSYRDQTIIDCQHYADGFVLNNNKDSDSPHAGFVDFSGVTTRNCENLRVYY